MRWLRPNSDPGDLERFEAEVEDVARSLEASMADAPASPRMAEIRAALLDEVGSIHHPALALRALALAAVVLLAVVVAVGAPVVGSYLDTIVDRPTPLPLEPEPEAEADDATQLAKLLRSVNREGGVEDVAASPAPGVVVETHASSPEAAPAPSAVAATVEPEPSASPTLTPETAPTPITVPVRPVPVPMPPIVPAP